MHIRMSVYKMSSLDELPDSDKDITSNEEEGGTRASSSNTTDHLLLGIYDTEGNLVDTIIYQDKDDTTLATYGTFTHTLKFGKYTLLALGWNGNQKCTVHRSDSISFSEGWTPHSFLCRQNIVVSDSYSDTRTLSLKRCVAKFTLIFKDASKPASLSDFVVRFSGAGSTLNGETGLCAETKDFERIIPVNIEPSKLTNMSSYCFLPADSSGISLNIVARDTDGNTLAERTFNDVPMKKNYPTKGSGLFFQKRSLYAAIEFDTDYDGEFEIDF